MGIVQNARCLSASRDFVRYVKRKRALSWVLAAISLLIWLRAPAVAFANPIAQQVCDSTADYFLGTEQYGEAIRLHREVLRKHPDSALAYYHLGFAYGMMNNKPDEMKEYEHAAALGFGAWDLFLNMGLADLQNHEQIAAMHSLEIATLFGPQHPESHFNLALVYERRGMLDRAKQELLASLMLDPHQREGRNLLAVVYAEQGDLDQAATEWRELFRDAPDYPRSTSQFSRRRNLLTLARTLIYFAESRARAANAFTVVRELRQRTS